jgi:hypothetical protein
VLGLVYNKSPCFCPVFGKVMKISGKWPIWETLKVGFLLRRGISYVKEITKSERNRFIILLIRLHKNWSNDIWYTDWNKKRLKLVVQQQKASSSVIC